MHFYNKQVSSKVSETKFLTCYGRLEDGYKAI